MAVPQVGADIDLLGLNDALDRLAELDERQGRIVELRFFAGLSIEETAEVMHLSRPASSVSGRRPTCLALPRDDANSGV